MTTKMLLVQVSHYTMLHTSITHLNGTWTILGELSYIGE